MKKYALLLLIVFAGCKRSQTSTPATTPTVLLTAYGVVAVAPHATEQDYTYKRDANNRVTAISYAGITVPYTYDAKGNFTGYGLPGANQVVYQFTYDVNGVITGGTENDYGTTAQINATYNYSFTITNNQVSQVRQYNANGSATVPIYTYNMTYDSNSNLIKRVKLNSDGSVNQTSMFTFGTHYSPQYTNHLPYNLSPLFDNDTFNTNEILTETDTYPTTVAYNLTYQFTYNGQYPIKMTSSDGTNSWVYGYTYVGL